MAAMFTALVLGAGAALYANEARTETDPFSKRVAIAWSVLFAAAALCAVAFAM